MGVVSESKKAHACQVFPLHVGVRSALRGKATPRGFEPLRAEPNGFRVHLLNRSDTVSVANVAPTFIGRLRFLAAIGQLRSAIAMACGLPLVTHLRRFVGMALRPRAGQ